MTEQEFQIELWDLFCKAIEENLEKYITQVDVIRTGIEY